MIYIASSPQHKDETHEQNKVDYWWDHYFAYKLKTPTKSQVAFKVSKQSRDMEHQQRKSKSFSESKKYNW